MIRELSRRGGAPQIRGFKGEERGKIEARAQLLAPELMAIRKNLKAGRYGERARLRGPLLEEVLDEHGMGGMA